MSSESKVTSFYALRFDHVAAIDAIERIVLGADAGEGVKLAALLGARMAMEHGGIPYSCLSELNEKINALSRVRDMRYRGYTTADAESIKNAENETQDCGSGCGD